ARRFEPAWVSDHLCWGSFGGHYAHDLLPLPWTEEALTVVVERITRVQERLGRRILVENVSSYVTFTHSTMPEWEFLAAVAERADCGLLLDVNNVYVSAVNHGFSAEAYLDGVPPARVGQIHLAGHSDKGTHLLDTHDAPVAPAFWRLVDALREDFPKLATVLGDGGFADLVRGYIRAHPSTAPSIRHLGRALPDFLAGYQPAYLADLARLEWTRLQVFDAPDATPLTAGDLRRI